MQAMIVNNRGQQECRVHSDAAARSLGILIVKVRSLRSDPTLFVICRFSLAPGSISSTPSKKCSYLVTDSIGSSKTLKAQKDGLAIVTEEWVNESIKLGELSTNAKLFLSGAEVTPMDAETEEERDHAPQKRAAAKKPLTAKSKAKGTKRKTAAAEGEGDEAQPEDEQEAKAARSSYAVEPVPVLQEPLHRPVFQNTSLRVLDVRIPPGVCSLFHSHTLPSVFVFVTNADLTTQVWEQKDEKLESLLSESGITRFGCYHEQPLTHRVCNVGSTLFRVFDIELLQQPMRGASASTPVGPSVKHTSACASDDGHQSPSQRRSASAVDPMAPQVVWENTLARMSALCLPQGQTSKLPRTSHSICIAGISGEVEISSPDACADAVVDGKVTALNSGSMTKTSNGSLLIFSPGASIVLSNSGKCSADLRILHIF
jgi:hypothetical protein